MFIRGQDGSIYNLDNMKWIYKPPINPELFDKFEVWIRFNIQIHNDFYDNIAKIYSSTSEEECDKILDGIYKEMESGSNFIDCKKIYDSITCNTK